MFWFALNLILFFALMVSLNIISVSFDLVEMLSQVLQVHSKARMVMILGLCGILLSALALMESNNPLIRFGSMALIGYYLYLWYLQGAFNWMPDVLNSL